MNLEGLGMDPDHGLAINQWEESQNQQQKLKRLESKSMMGRIWMGMKKIIGFKYYSV